MFTNRLLLRMRRSTCCFSTLVQNPVTRWQTSASDADWTAPSALDTKGFAEEQSLRPARQLSNILHSLRYRSELLWQNKRAAHYRQRNELITEDRNNSIHSLTITPRS